MTIQLTPAAFANADAALTLYSLARTSGAPAAYEQAAHALAAALEAERAVSRAFRRPAPLASIRPVDQSDPAPQSAPLPKAKSARKASPGDDLAERLTRPPRAKVAVSAFVCRWEDGSETRVSAVVYHAGKPATRWAAAFQAADRLRRLRHARYLENTKWSASGLPDHAWYAEGRFAQGPCGVDLHSQAWHRLVRALPMPALVAIIDEVSGETFSAAAGSAYGAGDPNEVATQLEAILHPPVKGIRPQSDVASAFRRPTPQRPISLGASCAGFTPRELDGREVAADPADHAAILSRLTAAHAAAKADFQPYINQYGPEANAAAARVSDASQLLERAKEVFHRLSQPGRSWIVRRDVGGRTVMLDAPGDTITLDVRLIPALRFVRQLEAVA